MWGERCPPGPLVPHFHEPSNKASLTLHRWPFLESAAKVDHINCLRYSFILKSHRGDLICLLTAPGGESCGSRSSAIFALRSRSFSLQFQKDTKCAVPETLSRRSRAGHPAGHVTHSGPSLLELPSSCRWKKRARLRKFGSTTCQCCPILSTGSPPADLAGTFRPESSASL